MGDKKRIVLADAAEEFRQMLADMIGGEADLTVCAQTGSGEELLDLIAVHQIKCEGARLKRALSDEDIIPDVL